jgi:hypothetical protein
MPTALSLLAWNHRQLRGRKTPGTNLCVTLKTCRQKYLLIRPFSGSASTNLKSRATTCCRSLTGRWTPLSRSIYSPTCCPPSWNHTVTHDMRQFSPFAARMWLPRIQCEFRLWCVGDEVYVIRDTLSGSGDGPSHVDTTSSHAACGRFLRAPRQRRRESGPTRIFCE